jgi:hypothetical protein
MANNDLSQKGFVLPIVVFVGFVLVAGIVAYKNYNPPTTPVETISVTPTTNIIETITSTPTATNIPTRKPTSKPVTKTPTPLVTGLTTDCSKFDKTKKATLTIHVMGKNTYIGGGWIAWLKPTGACPGETPGGAKLSYNATGTTTTYTFPEVVPGQFRLDVFYEASVGITIDLPAGNTTKDVVLDQ